MNAARFIAKWRSADLSERSAAQQHFLDLCELLDHPKPADVDPTGDWFTFEKGATKQSGGEGWADVWKKGFFAWEYKGKRRDLDAAYRQLLEYREALENPPLLVVSDMDRIVVRTNFTATPTEVHEIAISGLPEPRNLEVLRAVFHEPEKLRPGRTSEAITAEAAERIAGIAQDMRGRGLEPHEVAHFLDRIVFCLFAEDIDLLPAGLFSRLLENTRHEPDRFRRSVGHLFDAMAEGGEFGSDAIRHFNGNLFVAGPVLDMTEDEIHRVYEASKLDWSAVDPSIFGTLFERGMDPGKRSQIGAHYTSREDIETLVEPVVMWPLRREWDRTRETVVNLLTTGRKDGRKPKRAVSKAVRTRARNESARLVRRFHEKLTQLKVLDPACGSGNFLYVTLQKLKDLEKEVILFAQANNLGQIMPMVGPWQLYGIEVSPYAHDLAQMAVWIGYLQWVRANGFGIHGDPVLKPMAHNFRNEDAILDLTDPEEPKEPEWPKVDYIVGNPPFLGGSLLRRNLGEDYVDALFAIWEERVPRNGDLCCYWFERARAHIEQGKCERAGLLATQGIRGGANRKVLQRIKESGDIFFAESDRPWVLDGANVHVSMVGFDNASEEIKAVDGDVASHINANLTVGFDATLSRQLAENTGLCLRASEKGGAFELPDSIALTLLAAPNPHGKPNSDVIRPWLNARMLLHSHGVGWIIDYGIDCEEKEAALYEAPWQLLLLSVRPQRLRTSDARLREYWWLHRRNAKNMRAAVQGLGRFLAIPHVSKHRVVVWLDQLALPDHQLYVAARSDDYFFGVLHSRFHELWALRLGTRLETRPRYTPTTCFETFPLPWPPGEEPEGDPLVQAIADAARELNELRERWLNPPEWTTTEVLEFPGSLDGPWARYVHEPDERGIGTVRYPRTVDNGVMPSELKKRTLTNLYNAMPTWLGNAHARLDEAVAAAYRRATGDDAWTAGMSDEEVLEKLLALNLERSAG